jgi:hypothetical protein
MKQPEDTPAGFNLVAAGEITSTPLKFFALYMMNGKQSDASGKPMFKICIIDNKKQFLRATVASNRSKDSELVHYIMACDSNDPGKPHNPTHYLRLSESNAHYEDELDKTSSVTLYELNIPYVP